MRSRDRPAMRYEDTQTQLLRSCTITEMFLIQVVPSFLPKIDGIGDHALELARQLREEQGVLSGFLVCDLTWKGGPVEGFPVVAMENRTLEAFEAAIAELQRQGNDAGHPELLLQFACYGYEKRGCPIAFTRMLEEWHGKRKGQLHIAFHELENHTSNPLSSTFWLTGVQRWLVTRLARFDSFKYTNTEPFRHKLEQRGAGRIFWIPSFSTVGEPRTYPGWDQRDKAIVVFGRRAQRREAYGRGAAALLSVCETLGIRKIVDMGEPLDVPPVLSAGIEIQQSGRVSAEEVIQRMSSTIGSFLSYPVPLLTKSSIYAVTCACGAVPFVHDPDRLDLSCTGTLPNLDYVPLGRADSIFPKLPLETISRHAFANYKTRNSKRAAAIVAAEVFHHPRSR